MTQGDEEQSYLIRNMVTILAVGPRCSEKKKKDTYLSFPFSFFFSFSEHVLKVAQTKFQRLVATLCNSAPSLSLFSDVLIFDSRFGPQAMSGTLRRLMAAQQGFLAELPSAEGISKAIV